MNIRIIIAAILLLIIPGMLFSEDLQYKDYDWDISLKLEQTEANRKVPEYFLKDKFSIEFFYNEKGELEEYKLIHKIIVLNDHETIEKNNRIYFPSTRAENFMQFKARVITPSGKIKVLSDKDVKEAVDDKSDTKYRFYAVEGLEIGSAIEYLYFLKVRPSYSGTRVFLQSEVKRYNAEYEIVSPSNLLFTTKSYNGLPELNKDTLTGEKNIYRISLDSMPGLKKEDNATYNANLRYFIYKLVANTATGSKDINSYGSISEGLYKVVMATPEKAVQKKIKKFTESMNLSFAKDEDDKIRMIEKYIKSNIGIIDNEVNVLADLASILENKAANKEGITKLFAAVFNTLSIDYQLVLTCDRQEMKFDPKFESYNFLTDYLFYFPSIDKYLAPYEVISCLGFTPDNYAFNYGLFLKKVQLDNFETAIGKIKFIEPLTSDKTYDNTYVKLDFGSDISAPEINLKREMAGYYAQNFQPVYSFLAEDEKKKLNESLVKDFIKNSEVKKLTIENEGLDYFGKYPFIVKSNLVSHTLVENAGQKYLLKVGELIGPQMEMYQKEERTQPVENNYTRSYHREITFDIPEGYKVTNPAVLNMDVHLEENNEKVTAFISKCEINGNSLKIIVDEYYNKIFYPVSQYEDYRKVINAAADFNKLVLFLEKAN